MIEAILQQVTTTVTSASQLDFKTELAFWFTIIGSGLGFVLGVIKVLEWWTSRTARWVNFLAPKLRDIRVLMKQLRFVEADRLYHTEIHGKGLEPALRKISPPDTELPQLFFKLSILVAVNESDLLRKINYEEAKVTLTELADTARMIVAQIDKILEKAKAA